MHLYFSDLAPSVFAFCSLESLNIKPYFIKQNDVLIYPKKHKETSSEVNQQLLEKIE